MFTCQHTFIHFFHTVGNYLRLQQRGEGLCVASSLHKKSIKLLQVELGCDTLEYWYFWCVVSRCCCSQKFTYFPGVQVWSDSGSVYISFSICLICANVMCFMNLFMCSVWHSFHKVKPAILFLRWELCRYIQSL